MNMTQAQLEERLAALDAKVQLALDKAELQNIANKYQYLHSLILDGEIPKLYAQKTQVTRHDVGRGWYIGLENIKRYHSAHRPRPRSKTIIHCQGNPIIEVAGDGQTAKGLWFSCGFEGSAHTGGVKPEEISIGPMLQENKYGIPSWTHWVWHKIGIDFIKEDGQWKIWHYCYFELFRSRFDCDCIDYVLNGELTSLGGTLMRLFDKAAPSPLNAVHDRPSEERVCGYDITEPPSLYVREPEPYYTFSETFSY